MAKLSLRHVSKRYPNGFWAVKDFNLEMEDGEFVILTGSPKCGKSTVLRMIAGAEDVTEGILELDGKPINDVEPKDREIAMVFQYYSLYKNMTVYDIIQSISIKNHQNGWLFAHFSISPLYYNDDAGA